MRSVFPEILGILLATPYSIWLNGPVYGLIAPIAAFSIILIMRYIVLRGE
jgi:hypothetical protein